MVRRNAVVVVVLHFRGVFDKAVLDGEGILTLDNLVKHYEAFGGSSKVATELFSILNPSKKDFVTYQELEERLDDAVALYKKTYLHDDKSGAFYEEQMADDKRMMEQEQDSPRDRPPVHSTHDEF